VKSVISPLKKVIIQDEGWKKLALAKFDSLWINYPRRIMESEQCGYRNVSLYVLPQRSTGASPVV